jgi:hypothetical protein
MQDGALHRTGGEKICPGFRQFFASGIATLMPGSQYDVPNGDDRERAGIHQLPLGGCTFDAMPDGLAPFDLGD